MAEKLKCYGVGEVLRTSDTGVDIELHRSPIDEGRTGVHCPYAIKYDMTVRCGAVVPDSAQNAAKGYNASTDKLPLCYQLHARYKS